MSKEFWAIVRVLVPPDLPNPRDSRLRMIVDRKDFEAIVLHQAMGGPFQGIKQQVSRSMTQGRA
ncbi:hypothetical protein [Thermobaculum terrenum]|uniref:hypothetical protein n=1 Tax=Thermobaculum terrenum TaxID=166501 RepID=UPI00019BF14E|nr:hypothetical protein [Thermobaculum terrenum]